MSHAKAPTLRLLDAVRLLTRAHVVVVDGPDGEFLGTRNEPPLLKALGQAKVGGIGGGHNPGGGSDKRSTPLNVDATDLERRIERQYRQHAASEYGLVGQAPPFGWGRWSADIVILKWTGLIASAYTRGTRTAEEITAAARMVERTVQSIADLLDPPNGWDLTATCPECHDEWSNGFDAASNTPTRVRALHVTERNPMDQSHVDCRACGARWDGIHEVRRLAHLIETDTPTKLEYAR